MSEAWAWDETPVCPPHHWVIATEPGVFSPGKCKLCGAVRTDFHNAMPSDYQTANGGLLRRKILVAPSPQRLTTSVTGEAGRVRGR